MPNFRFVMIAENESPRLVCGASAMLKYVRKAVCLATFLVLTAALAGAGEGPARPRLSPQQPVQIPSRTLSTVVLDPAHGGTDEGAHGTNGIAEKDVTLALARTVEARLLREGWKVVMTRQGDDTVSFAQRAAIANAQTSAVFLSLHVGSSGPLGSSYAYYYDFGQLTATATPPAAGGMLSWDLAQRPWLPYSRRLARLLQVELSARLRGSPELPGAAAVYQLREINAPAVAVEIENVNAMSTDVLTALGQPLAAAISRALQAFRSSYQAEVR